MCGVNIFFSVKTIPSILFIVFYFFIRLINYYVCYYLKKSREVFNFLSDILTLNITAQTFRIKENREQLRRSAESQEKAEN